MILLVPREMVTRLGMFVEVFQQLAENVPVPCLASLELTTR